MNIFEYMHFVNLPQALSLIFVSLTIKHVQFVEICPFELQLCPRAPHITQYRHQKLIYRQWPHNLANNKGGNLVSFNITVSGIPIKMQVLT